MAIPVAAESETEFHALVRCHEPEPLVEAVGVRSCLVSGPGCTAGSARQEIRSPRGPATGQDKRVRKTVTLTVAGR
jgi:hypothetical protein